MNVPEISSQTFITRCLSNKKLSLELCPNKNLRINLLKNLDFDFCAIPFLTFDKNLLCKPKEIPAISLAKTLILQGHNVVLHLPGRNLSREEATNILNYVEEIGVVNILALRGDAVHDIEKDDSKTDFPYAVNLVQFIREYYGNKFCIGVAGYPNKHPDSPNIETDMMRLKEKVNAGADFIFTQASFEFDSFKNFAKNCQANGINIPIIPGIFIMGCYEALTSMAKFCGVTIPKDVLEGYESIKHDKKAVMKHSVECGASLIHQLLTEDDGNMFKNVHIYLFNDFNIFEQLCNVINK